MREINKKLIILMVTYIPIRVSSYLINPRPYLLWHAVLDTLVVLLFVAIALREHNQR